MRLIHAVRDLNAENRTAQDAANSAPIQVIALYTDAERTAMFVREADVAYPLGPASARPYLDYAVLERALRETEADAVWVGWGFVAEDPAFAELCERIGVTFIGPSPEAMRKLGDKIGSKLIAEQVGVPVAPWSRGAVDSIEAAQQAANEIGYPLMLKATAGGGGRGIRVVNSDDELVDAYQRTRDEAARAFGSGVVFLERLVTGARHVEVQVIADSFGTAWALGVRDCSVQRRNQKVIEESASPLLTCRPDERVEGQRRAAGGRRGLLRRRHRRVPVPPGREVLRVPRGEHQAAGRAPDHRDHDRLRPGQGPDPRRVGRQVGGSGARRVRARRRGPAQCRGPRPRLRPVAGPDRAARTAGRPGHPRRHRCRRGRHHPRRLRLDDRQDHRARTDPGGGSRPVAQGGAARRP